MICPAKLRNFSPGSYHLAWPFRWFHSRLKCQRLKTAVNICMFFLIFAFLNYRFNMPVFHVYRNRNTESPCLIPTLDFHDKELDQFFWKQRPLPCENWLNLFFVDSKGFLNMNQTAVDISGLGEIKCDFRYITRISEDEMSFSERNTFSEPVYLENDFIHVECRNSKQEIIYNNVHWTVETRRIRQSRNLSNEATDRLSVYIVGIDSLSRLIAERKLERTMKYLKTELNAYTLKGYTRIADSSYPNLLPLLTGLRPGIEDRNMGVNDLPYIFKNFSRHGAVDLWAEDWYTVASFKGFKEQPTQHYYQPLLQAMDKVRPYNLPVSMALKFLQFHNIPLSKVSAMCFGNIYRYKMLLSYYKRFIDAYHPVRKFAFSWVNEIAHDFFNMVELADDDYFELFKWMKETGKLENAVVIFMGDHGPRYSEIQNTDTGRLSNLLPLMSLIVPEHIRKKYPHIDTNLKANINKLTTAYDVFETLKDVLNGDFKQRIENVDDAIPIPRGISLFREIPTSRSCSDSAISEHYCPCYSSKVIKTDDYRVKESARYIVNKINDLLKDVRNICAKVEISKIQNASLVYADMQRDSKSERAFSLRSFLWKIKEQTRFRVTIRTNPGSALYESTVQYSDKNDIKILGDINRINKYGNQSACIQDITRMEDRIKRMYCFCL